MNDYRTILITGGAGFVGSNLAVLFKTKFPGWRVVCLDNLKRRGSEKNLNKLKEYKIDFFHGDIRNPEDLSFNFPINLLLDCAAEPAVLASLQNDPRYVINTNLLGTVNCLQLAVKHQADIIFISTSRVYPYDILNGLPTGENDMRCYWEGNRQTTSKMVGWDPEKGVDTTFTTNGPKSLYGATKLCSETLLHEYRDTFGLRTVINRCGIIAGPGQFGKADQGICMYWLMAHYFGLPLSYIGYGGKGKQVRDLLHIVDLFKLLSLQINNFSVADGKVYNVGGGASFSLSLKEMTQLCQQVSGKKISIGSIEETRPLDLRIYITDNSKATQDFGWEPSRSPLDIFTDMFDWIEQNKAWVKEYIHSF